MKKATLHLNLISYMQIHVRNIQDQQHIRKVKSTCNWHDFELRSTNFFKWCASLLLIYCEIACYISKILTAREGNMGNCNPEKTNVDRGETNLYIVTHHWFGQRNLINCIICLAYVIIRLTLIKEWIQ